MELIMLFDGEKEKRFIGYTTVNYKNSKESITKIETSESELNKLIPDSFEETDWKDVRRHYKLNGEDDIIFDEDYEPKNEKDKEE